METVLKKKVWKCLWEKKVVYIGLLRPATVTQVITEVVKVVGIDLKIPATLPQLITKVVEVGRF